MRCVLPRRKHCDALNGLIGLSILVSFFSNIKNLWRVTRYDETKNNTNNGNGRTDSSSGSSFSRRNDELIFPIILNNNTPPTPAVSKFRKAKLAYDQILVSSPQVQRMIELNDEEEESSNHRRHKKLSLIRSIQHQSRFERRRDTLMNDIPKLKLFWTNVQKDGVNILNDEYGALHIFKSGGTTIALQTGIWDVGNYNPEAQKRQWITFVRDPIDHFLSGWAECGHRYNMYRTKAISITDEKQIPEPFDFKDGYVRRLQEYLKRTKQHSLRYQGWCCEIHSFPQVNFMLQQHDDLNGIVYPQLQYVGDLDEMSSVLELANFTFNHSLPTARTAEGSWYKRQYYYSNVRTFKEKEIPDKLMIEICKFVAIDYYLLDFEPPIPCQGTVFHPNGTMVESVMESERNILVKEKQRQQQKQHRPPSSSNKKKKKQQQQQQSSSDVGGEEQTPAEESTKFLSPALWPRRIGNRIIATPTLQDIQGQDMQEEKESKIRQQKQKEGSELSLDANQPGHERGWDTTSWGIKSRTSSIFGNKGTKTKNTNKNDYSVSSSNKPSPLLSASSSTTITDDTRKVKKKKNSLEMRNIWAKPKNI